MMDDQLDWTEQLGNAVLAEQADVMDSIQRLRRQAAAAGVTLCWRGVASNLQFRADEAGRTGWRSQSSRGAARAEDPVGERDLRPGQGPRPALLVGTKNLWNKVDMLPATHGVVNAPLVAATATLVQTKLVLLQCAFYAEVSQRFVRAGDAVQLAAAVLNAGVPCGGPSSPPGCRCVRRPTRSSTR